VERIDANSSGDIKKFDDIKASLATFVFGDKRLWAAQLSGEANLSKASRNPGLDEKETEPFVGSCENRFRHYR